MKRRKPLARKTSLRSKVVNHRKVGTKVGRGNFSGKPRTRREEDEGERIYGTHARREWMHALGSVVSGLRPTVIAHVRGGGVSRKADACWTVPLTWEEHMALHQHGAKTFEAKYRVDLLQEAAFIHQAWLNYATKHGLAQ